LVNAIDTEGKTIATADLIIISIPVSVLSQLLPSILDSVKKDAVVIDTGSTKSLVCKAVSNHKNRGQFVAAHPIAGTENSGPTAAFSGLFKTKPTSSAKKKNHPHKRWRIAEKIFTALV
jgi:prephenate dehydrogenase